MATKNEKDNTALMAIVIGTLVIVFTAFHYLRFRSLLLRGNVYRIFDWNAAWRNLFASAVFLGTWFFIVVALVSTANPPNWVLWLLALASVPVLNWAGKSQALAFIGVVVDHDQGRLYFPPTIARLSLEQMLLVYPIIRRLTTPMWVELSDIEGINRQAGRRLFLHTRAGSVDVNFSNKLKRDECIHAIRSASGTVPERELEADYEYQ